MIGKILQAPLAHEPFDPAQAAGYRVGQQVSQTRSMP